MKKLILGAALASAMLLSTACGDNAADFTISSDAFFASDYETSYKQLEKLDCTKSDTHGGTYVKVYLSDDAKTAYDADTALPDGAILVKPQYSDDTCSTLAAITAMKKDSSTESGWVWQRAEADGTLAIDGQSSSCIGCHTNCMNDYLCSK